MKAAQLGIDMWIERVPTKSNIADLPSRKRFELLEMLRAERVKARWDAAFWDPCPWESLRLRARPNGAIM